MKSFRHVAVGLTLGAAFSMLGGIQSAGATSQNCILQDGLQQLFEARGTSDIKLELDARKGLLYIIADCTKDETRGAIELLESLDLTKHIALELAQTQLIGNLNEELLYVDTQKGRINDVGLRGTRDLAATVKVWRNGTHLPQLANANNFSLWQKNKDLIDVTDNRSRQINQTLRTLKLADRAEIKTEVDTAQNKLTEARKLNQTAHDSLSRLDNPEVTARTLHSSFSALSATYGAFFKISEEVKKILPL